MINNWFFLKELFIVKKVIFYLKIDLSIYIKDQR